jgi:hypothetical protein
MTGYILGEAQGGKGAKAAAPECRICQMKVFRV